MNQIPRHYRGWWWWLVAKPTAEPKTEKEMEMTELSQKIEADNIAAKTAMYEASKTDTLF